jgi:hypothetical protein
LNFNISSVVLEQWFPTFFELQITKEEKKMFGGTLKSNKKDLAEHLRPKISC